MSIKDRGKKYVEFLDFLRKEYIAKYGKEAEGLADTMLKRKAAEKVDEMMKVIPFPEGKITDWTKDRPKTGPKADVKTFPKQKKLTPETEGLGSFDKLKKELEEMEKLGQPYKDTSVSDFLSDYFDMPQKAPPKKTITELNDVKLYGDETFEELQIIKDTGKHPRDKKANGGRIGFSKGKRVEGIKSLMEKLNEKLSKKKNKGKVEIADDAPVSEKTKLQREFDEFNKRFKEKTTPDTKDLEKARGKYGSGEDLYKILKSEGITMDQAVKEAIDDMPRLSGDTKYDADAVADVMYEKLGIDPTTLDQYHLLDVYDNAYQQLVKQKRKSMYQTAAEDSLKKMDPEAETYAKELEYDVQEKISEPGYRGVVTEASDLDDTLKIVESQKSEATKLREKYPGISEALLDKLVKDNDPQRKAEVLAALDEVLTMMDKGMDEKQIMNVLRSTTRTKNEEGGLNTLKQTYDKIGDFVTKYSGIDSMIKLINYLNDVGTPEYTVDPFNTKPLKRSLRAPKLPKRKTEGLDYLLGM